MSENISQALSDFSTCEISDALIKLGSPNGGFIPDINLQTPATVTFAANRICGPAYTVQMVSTDNVDAPKLAEHHVDTAPANSVMVIDVPAHLKNAVWGGLMTAGAQALGVKGVVISGRCRDLNEHAELNFPVFARGTSTVGQSPFVRASDVNVPLKIEAQPAGCGWPASDVQPNDWIVADQDGVVCVPKDLTEDVVRLARVGRDVDARCMEDIKAGLGVKASFAKHRGKPSKM